MPIEYLETYTWIHEGYPGKVESEYSVGSDERREIDSCFRWKSRISI